MKQSEFGFLSDNSQCILLGNGINLLFQDPSWEMLIRNELLYSHNTLTYDEIKSMPATMQIVAATKDSVSERMKALSDKLAVQNMEQDRIAFLRNILALPVDDIMTANYSFELEVADGMQQSKKQYSSHLRSSFDLQSKHKAFRLYQYYESSYGKRVWHVHGDIAKPDTMLMGHYYYAKQLRAVQDCAAKTIQRYKICKAKGEEFRSFSWVDQFLTGNLYILGLGMYLCESDLWYLLCCKKRNFPETRVCFYDKDCRDQTICAMLKTYGVNIIDGIKLGTSKDFLGFYIAAMADISNRAGGRQV